MTVKFYPNGESAFHKYKKFKRTGEFRPPKKGEWFISGAIPEAYQAPNDLSTAYLIAKPVKTKIVEVEIEEG